MPDCGDNSCLYAKKRTGMRTNSSCRCDRCPQCSAIIKPTSPQTHREWCKMQAWIPPHHRGKMRTKCNSIIRINTPGLSKPLFIMHTVEIEEDDESN
jgi:hypothetical protein